MEIKKCVSTIIRILFMVAAPKRPVFKARPNISAKPLFLLSIIIYSVIYTVNLCLFINMRFKKQNKSKRTKSIYF